ncbi:MAG: hypothetical protein R6U32_03205 [Candidatus Woesearchaeota archaeon]
MQSRSAEAGGETDVASDTAGAEEMSETSASATITQFKNNLGNKIDTSSSYGRISTEEFETPVEYSHICFVAEDNPDKLDDEFLGEYPQGADVAESQDNVFLYDGESIDSFNVDRFEVNEDDGNAYGTEAICIPINNGQFSLRLEGLGDRTLISS